MEPTIPAGSTVTIDYAAYQAVQPERFDIVAFHPDEWPTSIFIFRVIGLPGETVTLTDAAVLIDGEKVSPPHALRYALAVSGINQTNLTATQFFLLGDNTSQARDSRYLGRIKRGQILGKVIRIEPTARGDEIPQSQP